MVTDEMIERAAAAMFSHGDEGMWEALSKNRREFWRSYAREALEAALSAAEPEEQDENPMRFFADNVDKWGALEWFNRLVDACEDHDLKRIKAFRSADEDEKDMLSLSADTSKMIMSSSAFQLARNHKDEIRSALSAQVQDVARDLPSEFEKWWDDAGHYVGGVVKMTYTQRKQLAWDAFYASANAAAPAKQEG